MPRLCSVSLTGSESQLFQLLLRVVSQRTSHTTMRVAGGWVRDKLLGLPSSDIDVAVDTMTGEEFATLIKEELNKEAKEEKEEDPAVKSSLSSGGVHVIRSNPEKSKHLETATMRLCGFDVDFVNLRTESYSDSSRVPTVSLGTPLQDAQRRDLTINALFYNIGTGQVEDHTEKGLRDLENGIARTPLNPVETFLDDPLRILRTARFAARFSLRVDDAIAEACRDPGVRQSLRLKVTRERIGKEIQGILRGPDPRSGLGYLVDYGLYENVLGVLDAPGSGEGDAPETPGDVSTAGRSALLVLDQVKALSLAKKRGAEGESTSAPQVLSAVTGVTSGHDLMGAQSLSSSDRLTVHDLVSHLDEQQIQLLFLAALVCPFRGRESKDSKGKPISLVKWIVMLGLKLPNAEADAVDLYLSGVSHLEHILTEREKVKERENGEREGEREKERLVMGHFVRLQGANWRTTIALATAVFAAKENTRFVSLSLSLMRSINESGLSDCWAMKPLLNGNEIAQLLGIKGGPVIGQITGTLVDKQLESPYFTRNDAESYVRSLLKH